MPEVGASGAAELEPVTGFGYRTTFRERRWELPVPSASALPRVRGRAVVVRGEGRYPRLHVETDTTGLDLDLALLGCA